MWESYKTSDKGLLAFLLFTFLKAVLEVQEGDQSDAPCVCLKIGGQLAWFVYSSNLWDNYCCSPQKWAQHRKAGTPGPQFLSLSMREAQIWGVPQLSR